MTNFNGGTGFGGGSLPPSTVYGDLTVTGKIFASDGALDAPSYSFTDDKKSGIYLNQGSGHGVNISGGSGGAQLNVAKDGPAVSITGTLSTTGLAAFGGGITTGTGSFSGTMTAPSIVTPSQPNYKRSATVQSIAKDSNQFVNFDTLVKDSPGNFTWSAGLGTYTAVVTTNGIYATDTSVSFAGSDAGTRSVLLYYSGVQVAYQTVTCSASEAVSLSVHYKDYVVAGQLIYVQVYSNRNGAATTINVSGALSIFKDG